MSPDKASHISLKWSYFDLFYSEGKRNARTCTNLKLTKPKNRNNNLNVNIEQSKLRIKC